ncbi:MAG TPA: hypothetical protein VGC56_10750 [Allosphingosinicella sp.]|jgi:hypothetical protein
MGSSSYALVLAVTLSLSGPGLAQSPAERDESPDGGPGQIVVTRQRERYSGASADVRSITRAPEDVVARFETPICPLALGLPPETARAIEARVRAVVRSLNLGAAPSGCRPNLTLVVADDGIGTIAALQKQRPNLFQTLSGAELRALKSA